MCIHTTYIGIIQKRILSNLNHILKINVWLFPLSLEKNQEPSHALVWYIDDRITNKIKRIVIVTYVPETFVQWQIKTNMAGSATLKI